MRLFVRQCHLRATASLLLIATLSACGDRHPHPIAQTTQPALASLVVHAQGAAQEQIWDGTVEAIHSAVLSAQTSARVEALPYDVNDVVPAGAVLVRFSNVEQSSATRAAKEQITAAQAVYANAKINYERIASIAAKGLIAKASQDAALAQRDSAYAALLAAQANWRNVGMQQDYTVVRAPYDAIVTRRYLQVGESVQAGPPVPQQLIAIASLKDLRVNVQIPQSAVNAIRLYHTAFVLPGDDLARIPGTSVTVFPYADPDTHSFAVRVEMSGDHTGLYPGMTVKVAFATGQAKRVLVPVSALVQRGELRGVYVIDHNQLTLRQVRIGHRYDDSIEILAGLDDGESIATDPAAAGRQLVERHRGNAP
jgi:RND family efflux transporter MFP subunit